MLIIVPQAVLMFAVTILAIGSSQAFAQEIDPNPKLLESTKSCKGVARNPELPEVSITADEHKEIEKGGNETCSKRYFSELDRDLIEALKCAVVFKRYDLLAAMYANGESVSRDLNKALQFACIAGLDRFVPDPGKEYVPPFISIIEGWRKSGKPGFIRLCEYNDNTDDNYDCVQWHWLDQEQRNNKTSADLEKVVPKCGEPAFRDALKKGRGVVESNISVDESLDPSSTGTEMHTQPEGTELAETLKQVIKNPGSCSVSEMTNVDTELNNAYKKLSKKFKHSPKLWKKIQTSQRRWLQFRNVAAKIACNETETYRSMNCILTLRRTLKLKEWQNKDI